MEKTAIEKMMEGYNKTEKEQDGGQELEAIQKDGKKERELTSIEKLMQGYKPSEDAEDGE